jgi:hypothetical protein
MSESAAHLRKSVNSRKSVVYGNVSLAQIKAAMASRPGSVGPVGPVGTWSALQDVLLMQALEKHADRWQVVSTAVPGKSPLECSARAQDLKDQGIQTLKDLQAKQKAQNAHKPPLPKRKFVPKKPSLFDNVPPLPEKSVGEPLRPPKPALSRKRTVKKSPFTSAMTTSATNALKVGLPPKSLFLFIKIQIQPCLAAVVN